MGIRDRPTSPRSPWQNAYVERLIGTLRRECLDHVLIFGERHLRRVLKSYSVYYNETRTHLGLGKDTPLPRPIQRTGTIAATPILSGLHHSLRADMIFGRDRAQMITILNELLVFSCLAALVTGIVLAAANILI